MQSDRLVNEAGARLLEYVRSDLQLARDIYKTYLKSMQTIETVQAKSSKVSKSDYVAVVEVDSALADARKEHSQNAQTAAMLFNKAMTHFPVAVADTLVRVAHIQNEQTAALSTQLAHCTRVLAKTETNLAALRHTHGKKVAPKAAAGAEGSEAAGSALSLSQGSSDPGFDTSDEQQQQQQQQQQPKSADPSPRKKKHKEKKAECGNSSEDSSQQQQQEPPQQQSQPLQKQQQQQQQQQGQQETGTRKGQYDIEGYLFKHSDSIGKGWHRRFFTIHDGKIRYYKMKTIFSTAEPIVALDIMLTAVRPRPDLDRRYCFELISPMRTFLLQAENGAQYDEWMAVIDRVRSRCLERASPNGACGVGSSNGTSGGDSECSGGGDASASGGDGEGGTAGAGTDGGSEAGAGGMDALMLLDVLWGLDSANRVCCDCGEAEPDWVLINLGVLCCIKCSGVHRSLGVSVSKVRSFRLDTLDPEHFVLVARLGNRRVNRVLEAAVPPAWTRPAPHASHAERERWIRAKYVDHAFVAPPSSSASTSGTASADATQALRAACVGGRLTAMLDAVVHGADVNARFPPDDETCLHYAVRHGQLVAALFLLQNHADPNVRGRGGNTALHYAAQRGAAPALSQLIRVGADLDVANAAGETAAVLAACGGHAQCAALLKLTQRLKATMASSARAVLIANIRDVEDSVRAGAVADLPRTMRDAYIAEDQPPEQGENERKDEEKKDEEEKHVKSFSDALADIERYAQTLQDN